MIFWERNGNCHRGIPIGRYFLKSISRGTIGISAWSSSSSETREKWGAESAWFVKVLIEIYLELYVFCFFIFFRQIFLIAVQFSSQFKGGCSYVPCPVNSQSYFVRNSGCMSFQILLNIDSVLVWFFCLVNCLILLLWVVHYPALGLQM